MVDDTVTVTKYGNKSADLHTTVESFIKHTKIGKIVPQYILATVNQQIFVLLWK